MAISSTLGALPASREQLSIRKPPAAPDSSDEARTDTSAASPSMNLERPPSSSNAISSKNRSATAPTASSSAAPKRRKDPAASSGNDDKPAPKQRKYERKTKRFIWPDDLHRLFVAAIFDVGLKNASPKALLALMEAAGPNPGLTTEHLKSHLQKYRLNYERSRTEFLEYYDRSAKRNLKRRRRQAQQRSGGGGGDGNTMFVFPISNSKRRSRHITDSDSDSSSDVGDDNNNSNVDAQGSTRTAPQGHVTPTAAAADVHVRNLNFSQLMQNGQPATMLAASGNPRQPTPQLLSGRLPAPAPLGSNFLVMAPQHLPPGYAAAAQRRQNPEHELAAAAIAAAAYRYPPGQVSAPVSAGMPELSDPQWSILNSLMSPQIAGMVGPGGEGALFPGTIPSGEAMTRGGTGGDGFMLHEEPANNLQQQIHLAMQAQMNLHRQMLTRKVEVSQHLARHSSLGTIDASSVPSSNTAVDSHAASRGLNETWSSPQQLQQQQPFQQQHYPLPRPSLPTEALGAQPPEPASSAPTAATAEGSVVPATVDKPVAPAPSTTESLPSGAPDGVAAAAMGSEAKNDDDGMDLYRWDRIDLNVELDDDDLFGFLKS